jgi:hypothetical protein
MAILEHLGENDPLIINQIHSINNLYLECLKSAETPNLKNMIIQGFMMNLFYDQGTTIMSLKQHQAFDDVFDFIFSNIGNMKKDFEIKRLVVGLATLLMTPNSCDE